MDLKVSVLKVLNEEGRNPGKWRTVLKCVGYEAGDKRYLRIEKRAISNNKLKGLSFKDLEIIFSKLDEIKSLAVGFENGGQ